MCVERGVICCLCATDSWFKDVTDLHLESFYTTFSEKERCIYLQYFFKIDI